MTSSHDNGVLPLIKNGDHSSFIWILNTYIICTLYSVNYAACQLLMEIINYLILNKAEKKIEKTFSFLGLFQNLYTAVERLLMFQVA